MTRALRGRLLATLLATIAVATSTSAFAQGTPDAPGQRARELASRGRAAFDRGDLASGCPLLAQAYELDGQLLGAGYALAECREKEGKLATAYRTFLEIAEKASARKEARADEAKARAAALEARVSRLELQVSEKAAARADLVIEVDGAPWPRAAWGKPEPIDGGAHAIAARAEGVEPWSTQIAVAQEGARVELALPIDRDAAPAPSEPAPAPAPPPEEHASPFPWKTAGLVTGGVGVALLGTGVVVAIVAKGDYDSVEDDCDAQNACTPEAAATREDARGLAGVGTVLFIGGAVLTTAGVAAFVFGPDDDGTAAALRVGPTSVAVDGRF